eukprot:174688_1
MEHYRNELYQHVNQAASVEDLLPMLKHVKLQVIKDILNEKIDKMTMNSTSELFHASMSIETIFPTDIIQHITSFTNNIPSIREVSTNFNKCYTNNNLLELKQKQMQFAAIIQTNKDNDTDTWIVDSKRSSLDSTEIEIGCKGPLKYLSHAIKTAKSGDKILLFNHKKSKSCIFFNIDKNLQIIGCTQNASINCEKITISGKVYFDNIKFTIGDRIQVCRQNRLFLTNCNIQFDELGIIVYNSGHLNVINSNFYGGEHCYAAIQIFYKAKDVEITGCMFTNCGSNESSPTISIEDYTDAKVKCQNNLFKGNYGIPIGRHDNEPLYLSTAIFRNNRVKNGSSFVDPIYYYCRNSKNNLRDYSDD